MTSVELFGNTAKANRLQFYAEDVFQLFRNNNKFKGEYDEALQYALHDIVTSPQHQEGETEKRLIFFRSTITVNKNQSILLENAWELVPSKELIFITSIASCQYLWEINDPDSDANSMIEVKNGKISLLPVEEALYDILVRPGNIITFYSLNEEGIHNQYTISLVQTLLFNEPVYFPANAGLAQITNTAKGFIKERIAGGFVTYSVHVVSVPVVFESGANIVQTYNKHEIVLWTSMISYKSNGNNPIYGRIGQFRVEREGVESTCVHYSDIEKDGKKLFYDLQKTFPDIDNVAINITNVSKLDFSAQSVTKYFHAEDLPNLHRVSIEIRLKPSIYTKHFSVSRNTFLLRCDAAKRQLRLVYAGEETSCLRLECNKNDIYAIEDELKKLSGVRMVRVKLSSALCKSNCDFHIQFQDNITSLGLGLLYYDPAHSCSDKFPSS